MKTEFKIRDHFLTKEVFSVVKQSEGVMKTEPDLDEKTLSKYYESNKYLSHKKGKGVVELLYSFFSKQMLNLKFNMIKKHINKKSLIVDFGCGRGGFLSFLAQKNFNVVGVENNDNAIKECSKKKIKTYKSFKGLKNKIDAIVFWHSFEHLSNPKEVVGHIKRLVSNNSIVVIALPNNMSFDAKYYRGFWAAYDVPRHRFHYSNYGITKTMKEFGFVCVNKKPLCLDSFYISMISEKYKNNKLFFFKGLIVGLLSNLSAFFNSNYSSSVFVFKKAI